MSLSAEGGAATSHLSRPRATYAVGLLAVLYTLNFLDRQIVNILAEAIKIELHLADWQLGVLTGLAFALVYSVASIPVANLADRGDRPVILSVSVAVWSGFTALCGLAQGFWHLALFRLGVGVGESGCMPAAHSLIADYTPKERRARALAIYQLGSPIGGLLGLVIGGVVADAYGWRAAFMVVGLPGVAIALVTFLTLPEPRRRAAKGAIPGQPFFQSLRLLMTRKAFPLLVFGAALITIRQYGTMAFLGSFFFRNHKEGLAELAAWLTTHWGLHLGPTALVGITLGVAGGVASALGIVIGGQLTDHWARRDVRHYVTFTAVPQLIAIPLLILGLVWPGVVGALLLATLPTFFTGLGVPPLWAGIQSLSTPATRATATAAALLATTLIGLGLGPLAVGAISDAFAAGGMTTGEGLRWALVIVEAPALVGVGLYVFAWRYAAAEMTFGEAADRPDEGKGP